MTIYEGVLLIIVVAFTFYYFTNFIEIKKQPPKKFSINLSFIKKVGMSLIFVLFIVILIWVGNINNFAIWAPLITSLVSLGTLWNVSRQRIISNRPDLHFESKSININYETSENAPNIESQEKENLNPKIFNIGLGTAKNLEVEWIIDKTKLNEIKKYDINNRYSFDFIGKNTNEFWIIEDHEKKWSSATRLSTFQKIDFVLPHKSNEVSETFLLMHSSFLYIYGIYTELFYRHFLLGKINPSGNEDFNIKLKVSYNDISGKFYVKFYKLNVEYNSYSKREAQMNFQFISL